MELLHFTGCSWNIVFFEYLHIFVCMYWCVCVFPSVVSVFLRRRTARVQNGHRQIWQSSEKSLKWRDKFFRRGLQSFFIWIAFSHLFRRSSSFLTSPALQTLNPLDRKSLPLFFLPRICKTLCCVCVCGWIFQETTSPCIFFSPRKDKLKIANF